MFPPDSAAPGLHRETRSSIVRYLVLNSFLLQRGASGTSGEPGLACTQLAGSSLL